MAYVLQYSSYYFLTFIYFLLLMLKYKILCRRLDIEIRKIILNWHDNARPHVANLTFSQCKHSFIITTIIYIFFLCWKVQNSW